MSKNKTIVIPILNDEYKVVVCWGDAEYIKKALNRCQYSKKAIAQVQDLLKGRRGVCFREEFCFPVVAFPCKPKTPEQIGTLAHESCHAVDWIFTAIAEDYKDEVYAHCVGAVVRGTLEKI